MAERWPDVFTWMRGRLSIQFWPEQYVAAITISYYPQGQLWGIGENSIPAALGLAALTVKCKEIHPALRENLPGRWITYHVDEMAVLWEESRGDTPWAALLEAQEGGE